MLVVVGEIYGSVHVFHHKCRIMHQSGNDSFLSLSCQLVIHYVLLFEAVRSNIARVYLNRPQIIT